MKAAPEGPDNQPVQLTNNEPRSIMEGSPPVAIQDESPTWSADGTRIAFASDRDGDYEIYRMRARPEGETNHPVQLTDNDTEDADPAWAPSGKRIAYSGAGDIWVMNASDGTGQLKLTTNRWADRAPSWQPTG
jgi:TolB protein